VCSKCYKNVRGLEEHRRTCFVKKEEVEVSVLA
jgi:hypothetical protein